MIWAVGKLRIVTEIDSEGGNNNETADQSKATKFPGPSKKVYASSDDIRAAYGLEEWWRTIRAELARRSAGGNSISRERQALVQALFDPLAHEMECK